MKNYLITLAALSLTLMSCNNQKQAKTVTLGPNPFITHMYTADPSAHVWEDGRLYVYASHDIDPPRGCDLMDRYHVFSTDDMVNWTDHGEILPQFGIKLRLVACEDRYASSLPMPSDMGCI